MKIKNKTKSDVIKLNKKIRSAFEQEGLFPYGHLGHMGIANFNDKRKTGRRSVWKWLGNFRNGTGVPDDMEQKVLKCLPVINEIDPGWELYINQCGKVAGIKKYHN